MRAVRAAAITAIALVGLTGCADRPNDLETYYDGEPSPTTTTSSPPPAVAPAPPPTATAPVSLARAAMLTDSEVAAEGVRRDTPGVSDSDCLQRLPPTRSGFDLEPATWRYRSGARLFQRVVAYPDHVGRDALSAIRCAGRPIAVPALVDADAYRAWADEGGCTVVIAGGPVISAVRVTGATESRAIEAVERLAPLLVGKLPTRHHS